ncbi:MAG: hypothetical protein COA78_28610 [Blastopirellula sp.]|nr:MAG: hypothetical protein COA78_28610 [Blastopirellula sp.]
MTLVKSILAFVVIGSVLVAVSVWILKQNDDGVERISYGDDSFILDTTKPFQATFCDSGWSEGHTAMGVYVNILSFDETGQVTVLRHNFEDWDLEKATIILPSKKNRILQSALAKLRVETLYDEYDAGIMDGGQLTIKINQGTEMKTVYLNNYYLPSITEFESQVARLIDLENLEFSRSPELQTEAEDLLQQLWEAMKQRRPSQ